jgi:hypothetical protein
MGWDRLDVVDALAWFDRLDWPMRPGMLVVYNAAHHFHVDLVAILQEHLATECLRRHGGRQTGPSRKRLNPTV